MLILNNLHSELYKLNHLEIAEYPNNITVVGTAISSQHYQSLIDILNDPKITIYFSVKLTGELSGEINIEKSTFKQIENEKITFIFQKKFGYLFFFTTSGFENFLRKRPYDYSIFDNFTSPIILVLDSFSSFQTCRYSVQPLTDAAPEKWTPPDWGGQRDARKYVKEIGNIELVPKDISHWLLSKKPEKTSKIYTSWSSSATIHLANAIPSEISRNEGSTTVTLKGHKSQTFNYDTIDDDSLVSLFNVTHEAIEWIYSLKSEAETKHTILASYLSLDWRKDVNWFAGLKTV